MDIQFNIPNKSYPNNRIQRTTYSIFYIPIIVISLYFFWNYENIYFLFLGLFQLSTKIGLPKEWSPTGPYSTIVPLIICILFELVSAFCIWCKNNKLDNMENNRIIEHYNHNNIKSSELFPGHIIKL